MTEALICPICTRQNPSTVSVCRYCGTTLPKSFNGTAAGARQAGHRGENGAVDGHVVAYRSDIGLTHHTNQDAGGAWTWTRVDGTPVSFIAVADGVSAGRKSEEASRLAIDMMHGRVAPLLVQEGSDLDVVAEALVAGARAANHEVAKRPHPSLGKSDATTLVAACCVGSEGVGVWCGDSRVYRLAPHGATRLTRDHSWAEHVVHAGLMSAEEASRDPRAHMITRWLGPPEQEDPGLEVFQFSLAPGEVVMCCTDGLYGYFTPPASSDEAEMARILFGYGDDLQAGVDALVEAALERGGRDNVTAAAIEILPPVA